MHFKLTHDWENHWHPRQYLAQYYLTSQVPYDEDAIIRFLIAQLRRRKPFETALDLGVGPTLHHEIALAPYVRRLDVADLLPQNLDEIRKWLHNEPDAHNWDVYIQGILKLEGIKSPKQPEINARAQLVKKRVKNLLLCNIKNVSPLNTHIQYPLVTAFYVADSVASSKADWRTYMANIANLVEPGGMLLISALRNAEYYRVGNMIFPSAKINEEDMREIFLSLNFMAQSLAIQVDVVNEWKDEGFDSIIVAAGIKAG